MTFEEFAELDNEQKRAFYLSLEWHPFVMSLLDETELNEGYPKADGLRRVGELLLGDIIDSKPTQVFPVNGNGIGRATVSYSITFRWWDGSERTYADVADVFNDGQSGNIDDNFIVFALATASTRAEGRALRKALKLKVCTAEEISDKLKVKVKATGNISVDDSITENQIKFMNAKCKQLNVDVMRLVNSNGERHDRIERLTKKQASTIIEMLNSASRQESQIPQEVLGYQENWRN